MRAIIFRGKDKNGKWVKGFYAGEDCDSPLSPAIKKDSIIEFGSGLWCEVQRDTIGESTGYVDCDGAEIFEGDIIEYEEKRGIVRFGEYDQSLGFYIEWVAAGLVEHDGTLRQDFVFWVKNRKIAVIGNIHDYPGLANLQKKQGKIVLPPPNSKAACHCSICGVYIIQLHFKYCGNCGAKLIGVGDDDENNDQSS